MLTHSAYILAVDGGLLAQLAFVLLALLGWVLNKAAEKKNTEQIERETEAKRQARADAPPSVAEVLDPFAEAPVPAPAPRPTPTPPPLQRSAPKAADRPALVQSLEAPSAGKPTAGEPEKRLRARERLGIGKELSTREAVRRAVLWSAVLGPPRAQTGPHRPPHMQRHRG